MGISKETMQALSSGNMEALSFPTRSWTWCSRKLTATWKPWPEQRTWTLADVMSSRLLRVAEGG